MTKFETFKTNNLYFALQNQSDISAQEYLIDCLKDESDYQSVYSNFMNIENAILNYKELNILDDTDISTISLTEVKQALGTN